MKVAIVHEYLIHQGGSENCVEALLEIFPDAPIFSCFYSSETMPERWQKRDIRTSFLQNLPLGKKNYQKRLQYFLPLMPLAYEQFDLRDFDLILSSCHAYAKGVLTSVDSLHISYIHTPVRYLWDLNQEYLASYKTGSWQSKLAPVAQHYLRNWDFQASQRPDYLVANSNHVQRRIEKFYRRPATTIYPPVDVDYFSPTAFPTEDYYLIAGRLVGYKRVDLAIQAFNQLGLKLRVVGEGPELQELKSMAKSNITFFPHLSRQELKDCFANCRALIFPGEEDFGIVPLEVQACGRPVIAYGRGGALETVVTGKTGLFFNEQTVEMLINAVKECENQAWDGSIICNHAQQFSRVRYQENMKNFIGEKRETPQSLRDSSPFQGRADSFKE
jgi:glycosyltransferase involved in cell wall biosynthesis